MTDCTLINIVENHPHMKTKYSPVIHNSLQATIFPSLDLEIDGRYLEEISPIQINPINHLYRRMERRRNNNADNFFILSIGNDEDNQQNRDFFFGDDFGTNSNFKVVEHFESTKFRRFQADSLTHEAEVDFDEIVVGLLRNMDLKLEEMKGTV